MIYWSTWANCTILVDRAVKYINQLDKRIQRCLSLDLLSTKPIQTLAISHWSPRPRPYHGESQERDAWPSCSGHFGSPEPMYTCWYRKSRRCRGSDWFLPLWTKVGENVGSPVVYYDSQCDRSSLVDNHRSWRISDAQTSQAVGQKEYSLKYVFVCE